MNYLTVLLAAEVAPEGGLFDLDATLLVMAVQFLILAAVLNALFYKPLGRALDERDDYVRTNLLSAKEKLEKAEQLTKQYEQELGDTRRQATAIIAQARAEAEKQAAATIAQAQAEAQALREQAQKEIDQQKQAAFASLEQEVQALSRQILVKLLGAELVR